MDSVHEIIVIIFKSCPLRFLPFELRPRTEHGCFVSVDQKFPGNGGIHQFGCRRNQELLELTCAQYAIIAFLDLIGEITQKRLLHFTCILLHESTEDSISQGCDVACFDFAEVGELVF